jgi:hypothetical protein
LLDVAAKDYESVSVTPSAASKKKKGKKRRTFMKMTSPSAKLAKKNPLPNYASFAVPEENPGTSVS